MTSYPSVFTASGTVCAVDSPALTSLPLRQALRWDSGLLPLFLSGERPRQAP